MVPFSPFQSSVDSHPIIKRENTSYDSLSSVQQRGSKRGEPEWTREENWILWQATHALGLKAWDQIAQQLGQRSPESCKERYFHLLNLPKTTKTHAWTPADDKELLTIAKRHFSPQNIESLAEWQELVTCFYENRRWHKDCHNRYFKLIFEAKAWTNEEESTLIQFMATNDGPNKWKKVAQSLGNKFSPQECKLKYERFQSTTLWTAEEDAILLEGFAAFGGDWDQWTSISHKLFKGSRSAQSCAARFNHPAFQSKNFLILPWNQEEKKLLIEAVSEYGEDWKSVAEFVKTRSADQCLIYFGEIQEKEFAQFIKGMEEFLDEIE